MKGQNSEIRQWFACPACTLCFTCVASASYWITPLLVNFISPNSEVPMSASEASWIPPSIQLSLAIFCTPAGSLSDKFGRRHMLMYVGPINIIAWAIIIMTRTVVCIYIARFIQGFAVAIALSVISAYIAEIAEPKIRGKLNGVLECGWVFGSVYVYTTGAYLNYNFYALACTLIAILTIIFFCIVPESPYYLLMQKKEQEAREVLIWLQHSQNIDEELLAIKEGVGKDMERKSNWKDLFATKQDIKAFFIVQFVCFVRYFGGCISLQIYVHKTIHEHLDIGIGSNELTIIFGIIILVITILSSLLNDIIGRRMMLFVSSIGGILFNSIVALIYFMDEKTTIDVSQYKWIAFVSIVGFAFIGNYGFGSILLTIQGEYFPTHTRSIGGGITQTLGAIFLGISLIQFAWFDNYFGAYMNFLLFGFICLGSLIFTIILIPETSGQSLSHVQKCFNK